MAKTKGALEYHSMGRKGKIEVISTKPCLTAEDLSLAYSPGVAEPCLAIEKTLMTRTSTRPRETWWRWFPTARPCWVWEIWEHWPANR